MKSVPESHLVLSDFHIPDHNKILLDTILGKFIPDLRPSFIHILGDYFNFTKASTFEIVGGYDVSVSDEIEIGRVILNDILKKALKANKKCQVLFYQGNHEFRFDKYLARSADQLIELKDKSGQQVISIPHLMDFNSLKVKYIPYFSHNEYNNVIFAHGTMARSKAGYTANGQMDRFGTSGITGHTHRLSYISRTQNHNIKWWIENGCLCNLSPTPCYVANADWQNGFSIINFIDGKAYPEIIPVINNTFSYHGKLYRGIR